MLKFEDLQQGQYIINKMLRMEGIVLKVKKSEVAGILPVITLFCTKDDVYKFNVGDTINLSPCEGWVVAPNDREFR
tara:strand:+ start:4457 stop:4684 length:228 start_codon:yes stop_codon:yes gene_type:complete